MTPSWGLPSKEGWEFDEIMPLHVNRSIDHGVPGGWLLRYPPGMAAGRLRYQALWP